MRSSNTLLSRMLEILHSALIKRIQRLQLGIFLPQYETLKPPGQPRASLILDESACRDCEDVVELFQGALLTQLLAKRTNEGRGSTNLGLRNPQEDPHKSHHIQRSEETKGAGWRKCIENFWESET